jgi:hypothetical protein
VNSCSSSLFEEEIGDPVVRRYVEILYGRLVSEKKIDISICGAPIPKRLLENDRPEQSS